MPEHGNPAELSRLIREYKRSGIMKFIKGSILFFLIGIGGIAFGTALLVLITFLLNYASPGTIIVIAELLVFSIIGGIIYATNNQA